MSLIMERSSLSCSPSHLLQASIQNRDFEILKRSYVFTHCVELPKLQCILEEQALRKVKITEFAQNVLKHGYGQPEFEEYSSGAEQILDSKGLDQEHPFMLHFNNESKIFVALAHKSSVDDPTILKVNKM